MTPNLPIVLCVIWAVEVTVSIVAVCRTYARGIGTAFEKRTDLRVIICNALATLCLQNRQALKVSLLAALSSASNTLCIIMVQCLQSAARLNGAHFQQCVFCVALRPDPCPYHCCEL